MAGLTDSPCGVAVILGLGMTILELETGNHQWVLLSPKQGVAFVKLCC
ncbi:MAG: hypothetical protein WCO49_02160 [Nostocales cyanobacterium ELA608]|jgi:hypothetical protein|nr:hypothetical protein [Nostocales cyanobacterium W4_Combined_metabat2_030]